LVPLSYYGKDRRILSVMIEVNRRLYMDERTEQKRQDFGMVRAAVGRIIVIAAEAAIASGGVGDALC
jgi:N-formylglutamate deformylase